MKTVKISELIGKTLTSVKRGTSEYSEDQIIFTCKDGTEYRMFHNQDCCESVGIKEIAEDLADLEGCPILQAEETSEHTEDEAISDIYSKTWTFYKFATIKGYVTIFWYGESNGNYSELVDFKLCETS